MLLEKTVYEFLEELGSKSPAPGGGSVAALNGATGAALISMVCNLTLGKKKYSEFETEVLQILEKARILEKKLANQVQADTDVYLSVRDAFMIKPETMDEKIEKQRTIDETLKDATLVPFSVMELCLEGLQLTSKSIGKTNKNAISDLGSAASNFKSGLKSAYLNVLINLKELTDEDFIKKYNGIASEILKQAEELEDKVYKDVLIGMQ
ncbi:MAG: cyclodeaminase/cyclohydrolase family protein [Defluviitaleaceae bacterium]|nr:cyclodeaminase/cyclohydrolase family protein [Defluviitaleaceae bacterium]